MTIRTKVKRTLKVTSKAKAKQATKPKPFRLEEATIADLHQAIRSGRTNVVAVVQGYLARVRAYNGVASMLVTADGAAIPEAKGAVRAGAPLRFPTQTVKADTILPDLDQYKGPPLEFGRMEATASKPDVQQQFGMIVGIPNAGQLNAIGTLNIRGERSVTCWGEFDRHPSQGPLPPGAPPVCEFFRRQPDALERAAELDKRYGRKPDLAKMPMYGVVFGFKDPFDTKDMRSTGGGDAGYDIDFPARDHVLVEQLRNKGAIIFAKAVNTEYNGRAGDPGGRNKPNKVLPSTLGYQRSTWAGNPSNVYDTTRSASLGSSSGSGRVGQRQPRHGRARRGDARIVPRAVQSQCGGVDPAAQGHARLRRRRDRRRYLLRPERHPRPPYRGLRENPRRAQGPGRGLLRSARRLHHRAALVGAAVLRGPRQGRRRARGAEGPAARRDPRVDANSAGLEDRGADRHGGGQGDQDDARRPSRGHAGGIQRADLAAGQVGRADEDRLPHRAGAARAGVHARSAVPGARRRRAGVPGLRRRDRADRVHAGKGVRLGHDAADRLLRRHGRRPDRAAEKSRPRHRPESGDGDGVPLPHLAIPDAPRRGLEGQGLHRDPDRLAGAQRALEVLGRRSARRVQELGGGRRSAQSARPAARRQRAHYAAGTPSPRRHDGDPGEQARRAGAAAHAVAAGR